MKRLIFGVAILFATLGFFSSCSDDSEPAIDYYQNIVTFEGNVGNSASRFTYRAIDDSPLITLTAPDYVVETDSAKGQYPGVRVFITYSYVVTPPAGDLSGNIRLVAAAKVYQDTVTAVPTIPLDFTEPYQVVTLTRSGQYLNLVSIAPETKFYSRHFYLEADESTLGDAYPQLYLRMSTDAYASQGNETRVIGSFDMSPVWNLPTAQGVEVHVSGEGNPASTLFKFSK